MKLLYYLLKNNVGKTHKQVEVSYICLIIRVIVLKAVRAAEGPRTEPQGPGATQKWCSSYLEMRDDISSRMHALDEFISTYRLKTEYPPASRIVSYLKFERSTPHSLKEQSRVIEQQEAIKNSNEDDF